MFDRNEPADQHRPGDRRSRHRHATAACVERTLIQPDRNDFAPRVGLAWSADAAAGRARPATACSTSSPTATAARASSASTCRSWSTSAISANSGQRRAGVPLQPRASRRSTPATVNPAVVQWRIQDPESEDADRPPVQHRPRSASSASTMVAAIEYVGNRTRNGRRLRNLNEGVISAGRRRGLSLRAVRLRQRLPRADRHQRPRRLQRAADAHVSSG